MKLIYILLIFVAAVSCEKVDKSIVTVTIKDKKTGENYESGNTSR